MPTPIAIDAAALPWEERFNEKIGKALYRKNLIEDPDTGMEIRLVKYPAGIINPLHTHPCAHGMYVLEGTLVANGNQYRPGNFVWFRKESPWTTAPHPKPTSSSFSSPTSALRSITSKFAQSRGDERLFYFIFNYLHHLVTFHVKIAS